MGSSHPESKLELCGKAALPQGVGVWSPRSDSPGLPATPGAGDRVWECILLGEVVFLGLVFIYFFKDVLLKKQRDVFHLLDHNTPPSKFPTWRQEPTCLEDHPLSPRHVSRKLDLKHRVAET